MEHKVTGCDDCPFLTYEDMIVNDSCNHPLKPNGNIVEVVRQQWTHVTPEWCPLNKEQITIIKEQK